MYDRELIETKKKVDKILARRTAEYQQGYQDGAKDMEQAKQIIIDSLLKQIEQIRVDVIEECIAKINREHTHSAYNDDVYEAIMLLEQLKEQKQ